MNILGIDPGTGRTGWGVIHKKDGSIDEIEYVAHGCITTSQDFLMQDRLVLLHTELSGIIRKFSPDCIVVEQIFFGLNSKTAISVSQARGVIMLAAAQHNLPFFEYTSISVKHYLTGSGRAEKKQMQEAVRKILSRNRRTLSFSAKDKAFDDAADGLAIAIHHTWKSDGKVIKFPDKITPKPTKKKLIIPNKISKKSSVIKKKKK